MLLDNFSISREISGESRKIFLILRKTQKDIKNFIIKTIFLFRQPYLHTIETRSIILVYLIPRLFYTNGYNNICIPESVNTNISYQLFDYTLTFVNPQH